MGHSPQATPKRWPLPMHAHAPHGTCAIALAVAPTASSPVLPRLPALIIVPLNLKCECMSSIAMISVLMVFLPLAVP